MSSGPAWYDMHTSMEFGKDPSLQRELRLLQMRNALNPKQHYKKAEKELPRVFQVIVPVEFLARLMSLHVLSPGWDHP
jgi:hypothetical protein